MSAPSRSRVAQDGGEGLRPECEFCAAKPVRHFVEGRAAGLSLDQHHTIFHSSCQSCLDGRGRQLCKFCRHLRLDHYLGCCQRDNLVSCEMWLDLRTFGSLDFKCMACVFWYNLLHLRPNKFVALQSDVTISLWLDYTEESSPKWPLMLRADPVGERWTRWNLRLQGTDGRREIIAFGARVASQLPNTGTSGDTPRLFQATIDWESVSQFPFGIRPSGEEALQILPGISEFWDESKAASKGGVPDSLRVIDVLQDCVVTLPPSASYVTLSYMWGQRQDRLQATMDNVTMLSQPGSLSTAVLPRTISDALQACKNLGQRYIWVDRLCVCQDDPNIKVLLDLMGAIYHNASFTIVAVDGDAESGLPGVGETKRLWPQASLILGKLHVLACAPNLRFYPVTPWASRGWTFQEEVMSNRLLYFTHCGLYYSAAGFPLEFSECLAEQVGSRPRLQSLRGSYWGALHSYSGRLFKYPKDDFLRAFSGLLFSMYGAETLWGLPKKHFDEALLWNETKGYNAERDSHAAFPSWSWTAASGVISSRDNADPGSIEPISAVATWVFVPENASSEKALTDRPDVTVLRPASELDHFSRSHRSSQDIQDAQRRASRLSAALVYFQGCVQIPPQGGDTEHDILDSVRRSPDSLRHHSRSDLDAAFQKRWPRYIDFWEDTLGSPLVKSHFSPSLVHAASITGRILVHTQRSSFRLDPLTSIDTRSARLGIPAVIRGTADNTPAGIIYHLREDWLQAAFAVDRVYEFIALSTETESLLNYSPWIFCFDRDVSMMSRFAGCTCSQPVVEGNLDGDIAHIPLCPRHPEFPSTPEGKSPWDSVADKVSSSLAYRDVNGANLVGDEHRFNKTRGGVFLGSQVASLNVMLVERSPGGEGIYKRVGLGKIFLKKWVESNPSFKALVLS